MKRKILIATPSLNSGGVEVSLIRFLNELSKNKELEIDLLLLKKEGIYLEKVPKNIKVLELKYINDIYNYNHNFNHIRNIRGLKDIICFFGYRLILKKYLKENNFKKYYNTILNKVKNINNKYDLAIDYHGYGHFITSVVAKKITASKKASWIHDEKNDWLDKIDFCINDFNKFFAVSKSCKNASLNKCDLLKNKVEVFYNLTDYENVRRLSKEKMDFKYDDKIFNFVTVGRLEWQKGYDISIKIAKIIKQKEIKFCWYIIGDGTQKEYLLNLIQENELQDYVKLIGIKKNPFPYILNADLYIQTSRHEGYGLAIAEAKILGKVVVATSLPCIREQIIDGENGLLCDLDELQFSEKIILALKDKKLHKKIKNNLSKENFDFSEEFDKLYQLMK